MPDNKPVQIEIQNDQIPVTQSVHEAPVIQIDGAVGLTLVAGLIKFNLYQDRLIGVIPGKLPIERVVCARLVMTPLVLKQLSDWLAKNLSDLIAAKAITIAELPAPKTQ